ncbi:MAG: peroxiredoxin-like family protein [Bacteroidota bacterium]
MAPTPSDICPLNVGSHIPDVNVATVDGSPTNLRDQVRQKPTILVFYRGGWCPYCNSQLQQLHEAEPELVRMGYQILAISADRPSKLRESVDKHSLGFTLLSDSSMAATRAFGIAFQLDQETVQRYKKYDMDLEEASGKKHHQLPVPAVYIVGTDRLVCFAYAHPNHQVRLDPDVLLAAAKAALK